MVASRQVVGPVFDLPLLKFSADAIRQLLRLEKTGKLLRVSIIMMEMVSSLLNER